MYQRILVPVDGSPTSNAGLAEAVKLAKVMGARVQLLHAVDELPLLMGADGFGAISADVVRIMTQSGERILAQGSAVAEAAGVDVNTVLLDTLSGRLDELVVKQAKEWKADLIVLGTHGRRGVQHLMIGSDAERVLHRSPVPVLLVRGLG